MKHCFLAWSCLFSLTCLAQAQTSPTGAGKTIDSYMAELNEFRKASTYQAHKCSLNPAPFADATEHYISHGVDKDVALFGVKNGKITNQLDYELEDKPWLLDCDILCKGKKLVTRCFPRGKGKPKDTSYNWDGKAFKKI